VSTDEACSCAAAAGDQPPTIGNRPGLRAVSYRSGEWAQFRARMLDALSTAPQLAALRTREPDDFAIALIDAWAVACDILTFYQERIANEAYLRTATERISLGELAKLIGYKLRPGLAASAALAFTLETPPPSPPGPNSPPAGLPSSILLPAGTQGQTIPDPGARPATFETLAPRTVRAAWNAIAVRQTLPVAGDWRNTFSDVRLSGLATGVKVGDRILVAVPGANCQSLNQVTSVRTDPGAQTTTIGFEFSADPVTVPIPAPDPTAASAPAPGVALDDAFVWSCVRGSLWADQGDLVAFATAQNWSVDALEQQINALRGSAAPGAEPPRRVYAMGTRAALFGHNAMDFRVAQNTPKNPYDDWESATLASGVTPGQPYLDLDGVYPVTPGDRVVVADGSSLVMDYSSVGGATELTRTGYYLSAKVTRIWIDDWPASPDKFGLRTTQVFLQTQQLDALDLLDPSDVSGGTVTLGGAYLSLLPGQLVTVTGVRSDRAGQTESEVAAIASVSLVDGYTRLELSPALSGRYLRASVRINANTAEATHGESTSEILGSGDAAASFQRFRLRQPPLTYISAATPSGSACSLTVRVDGVAWTEVPWLAGAGPNDRVYTVVAAVDGTTCVQFGDGVNGARPGSGTNNIVAEYRHGTGTAGLARAGQISTLLTRPLGLKAVTNPLPSVGAADPETVADARANAPVTVRTLDRIVSLDDVADFAAASAGVAKAATSWTWDGTRYVACVTVAGADGALVPPGSDQYRNLLLAMQDASDGMLAVALCSYIPVSFTVAATISADPSLVQDDVLAAVRAALRSAFSFDARDFAQPVFASEVIAVAQAVPGVVSLTLDAFARKGDPPSVPPDYLAAAAPTLGGAGLVGAELLTLDPGSLPRVVLA
jgi:predicted phage baseplate assembly protein